VLVSSYLAIRSIFESGRSPHYPHHISSEHSNKEHYECSYPTDRRGLVRRWGHSERNHTHLRHRPQTPEGLQKQSRVPQVSRFSRPGKSWTDWPALLNCGCPILSARRVGGSPLCITRSPRRAHSKIRGWPHANRSPQFCLQSQLHSHTAHPTGSCQVPLDSLHSLHPPHSHPDKSPPPMSQLPPTIAYTNSR